MKYIHILIMFIITELLRNSGLLINQRFLTSVARGQTKTLTSTVDVSGTVTYSAPV